MKAIATPTLAMLLMLLALCAHGQATTAPAQATPAAASDAPPQRAARSATSQVPAAATQEPSASESDREILLLKEQLKNAKEFQSDILQTVYWALGFVAALALVLIGYQTWREKQALLRELANDLQTQIGNFEQKQTAALLEERKQWQSGLEEVRNELRTRIDQAISDERDSRETAVKKADALLTEAITNLDKISKVRTDFLEARLQFTRKEAAEEAGRFSRVITYALGMLDKALELEAEWYIVDALDSLAKAIDNSGKFSASELERTPELLKRVPVALASKRDAVVQRLPKAQVMQ